MSSPQAIIIPAKTHPDVVVQAVAARDRERATAYAKKYGIPEVKATYQGT
jgi:predicted dehydrogenase